MGLSVFVAPEATALTAVVSYADYVLEKREPEDGGRAREVWWRTPRAPVQLTVPLEAKALAEGVAVPDGRGLYVKGTVEAVAQAGAQGLAEGTRAVSVFLVNERAPDTEKKRRDEQFVFQVGLALEHAGGFVARPNRRGEHGDDWDERVADLQFRHRCEYAVGHGVSVAVEGAGDGPVTRVRTAWVPRAEVKRVRTRSEAGVVTSMEALADLADGAAAAEALDRLPEAYGEWIAKQRAVPLDSERRRGTRDALMDDAERARGRIAADLVGVARPSTTTATTWSSSSSPRAAARPRRTWGSSRSRWCCGGCAGGRGPNAGLLRPGAEPEFVFVLDGFEYKVGGVASAEGVTVEFAVYSRHQRLRRRVRWRLDLAGRQWNLHGADQRERG
jgi:hypothetical protein